MSMIDFIKKHEKVLQDSGRDDHRQKLTSLKSRLEELQSMKPDYQKIANEIHDRLEEDGFLPEFDMNDKLKPGDWVVCTGEHPDEIIRGLQGRIISAEENYAGPYFGVEWEKNIGSGESVGNGKYDYCNYVWLGYLKKVGTLGKPKVKTKNDYNNFLTKLMASVNEEYLDHDDKDFNEDDEVELLEKFFFNGGEVTAGVRGDVRKKCLTCGNYHVYFKGILCHVRPERIAKVKSRNNVADASDKIIANVEQKFSLSEYEDKKGEINNEISKLIEDDIVSAEEIENFFESDILADFYYDKLEDLPWE